MEAKYIAASTTMRELLLLQKVFNKILQIMNVTASKVSSISSVWEDNAAVLTLMQAPLPKMTPQTKHIAVKYHWFCQHLCRGEIEVKKISTDQQKADIFMKGLHTEAFLHHHKILLGW